MWFLAFSSNWNVESDQLDFYPSLNWIVASYTSSKNPVQTRKKNPVHQIWHFKNQAQIDGENHKKVLWTLWQYLPGNPDLLIIFPTISSCVFCSFYCFLHQCFHDVRLSTHAMAYQILYLGSWKKVVTLSLNFEKDPSILKLWKNSTP